jgi:hypothetical protein
VKGELLIAQVPISDFRPSTTSVYSGLAPNDFPLRLHFFSDLTDLTGSVMGTKCFVSLCGNYIHDVSTLDRTKMCKIASVSVRSNANQGDASQQGMAGSESVKPHAVPCCTTMYRLG